MTPKKLVLEEIKLIVSSIPGCFLDNEEITSTHQLREDLGLDSLAMVDLMVSIEDAYHIYFDPTVMDLGETFDTIESLVESVIKLTSGKSS